MLIKTQQANSQIPAPEDLGWDGVICVSSRWFGWMADVFCVLWLDRVSVLYLLSVLASSTRSPPCGTCLPSRLALSLTQNWLPLLWCALFLSYSHRAWHLNISSCYRHYELQGKFSIFFLLQNMNYFYMLVLKFSKRKSLCYMVTIFCVLSLCLAILLFVFCVERVTIRGGRRNYQI